MITVHGERMSISAAARKYGVPQQTLSQRLKVQRMAPERAVLRAPVKRPTRRAAIDRDDLREAVLLLESGKGLAEIQDYLGWSEAKLLVEASKSQAAHQAWMRAVARHALVRGVEA